MGKEDKEDSGFGFKDKAKAEETLRLLESHEPNYRRLTVRGLLGRAKRVLSMTKAEEKIKNIKEAMAVFEAWLAALDAGKEKKGDTKKASPKRKREEETQDIDMEEKETDKEKVAGGETVPGLGFKDAAAAEASLQALEGRDPDYQRLAVRGLLGRARRVLTCTRDETKLSNIKEAMAAFEAFLEDFDAKQLGRLNNPYLSLGIVRTAVRLAGGDVTDEQRAFVAAYASVSGDYKRLRTVPSGQDDPTWDIVRNYALNDLKEKHADAKLFTDNKEPTKEHLEMLLWAYSPEPAQAKKLIPETKEEDKEVKEEKEKDSEEKKEDRKRKSSPDSEESPAKKQKE